MLVVGKEMLPLLIDIVFGRLLTVPEANLDDTDNLALWHKAPIATVIGDAAVIPQNKVFTLWYLVGPIMGNPAVFLGNTVQGPRSGTTGTFTLADVALVDLLAIDIEIAILGFHRIARQTDDPLDVFGLNGNLWINTIGIKYHYAATVNLRLF